jgi:putative inorganic carbon (hco3(-)) transporter
MCDFTKIKIFRHLADKELWIIGPFVLAGVISSSFLVLSVLLLAVFWIFRWIERGKGTVRIPLNFPLAILVVIVPINYWISPMPEKSFPQLMRLLLGIGFFYSVINWITSDETSANMFVRGRLETFIRVVVFGLIGLCFYSLFSVEWVVDKFRFVPDSIYYYMRLIVDDSIHPNVLAGIFVILLPIPIALIMFAGNELNKWEKVIGGLAIFLGLGLLVLTQSRGGIIAFGISMAVLVSTRWRSGRILVVLGSLAGVLLAWNIGWTRVWDLILFNATLTGVNARIQIWQRALYMIQDFPLTGVGMGLFGDVANTIYPFLNLQTGEIPHAHQLFLQIAVDLGIPGFLAWFTAFSLTWAVSIQLITESRRKKDRWMTGLAVGVVSSLCALTVHGFLDAVTWGMVRPAPVVWGIWALAWAAWLYYRQELNDASN